MKKLITALFAIVLILSSAIPSFAAEDIIATQVILNDLETAEYKNEILKLVEDGTISGYEDGTFRPKSEITRGEFAKILTVTLKLELNPEAAKHFTDVDGKWNQGYIGALYNAKIMIGLSENEFGESKFVTREELAVVILRIFELENIANQVVLDIEFKDNNEVSEWAKNAVSFANSIGLIEGFINEDNTKSFLPKQFGERELVAKSVYELKYNRDFYEEIITELKENLINNGTEEATNNESKEVGGSPSGNNASYESIVSKYSDKFSTLENSVNSKISSLILDAKEEYRQGASVSGLISKYEGKAQSLEASTDEKITSLLESFEDELRKYGYGTDVVSDFETEYNDLKQSVKNSIIAEL